MHWDPTLFNVANVGTLGLNCSLDLSAPSILLPRFRVPSTPSTLLSIYIWIVSCGKDENKQREAGIDPFSFKKNLDGYSIKMAI